MQKSSASSRNSPVTIFRLPLAVASSGPATHSSASLAPTSALHSKHRGCLWRFVLPAAPAGFPQMRRFPPQKRMRGLHRDSSGTEEGSEHRGAAARGGRSTH